MYDSGAKSAYKKTATSTAGIKLEIRTDNNSPSYQELWIDGAKVFTITPQMDPNPALGMNIGFFASAASGKVGFLNRRIFDVSKEVELTYTANNEESFNLELVARRAPGVPTPVKIDASHSLLQVVNGAAGGMQQATLHISANATEDYSRGRDSVEVRIKSKWRPFWSANP